MAQRLDTLYRFVRLVGEDIIAIREPMSGWPSLVEIDLGGQTVMSSVHVGPMGSSNRGRDDVERRFQNPGKDHPVKQLAGTLPLLIGLWEEGPRPLLVAMGDPAGRIGKVTRQSFFAPMWLLQDAMKRGWQEHVSASGERVTAFHPRLLPVYVKMTIDGTPVTAGDVITALDASGINEDDNPVSADRARRATMALVRQQGFRRKVIDAYGGLCAMCSLNLGLVQGAHIYPASAPDSKDEVWNGLALCSNHHGAFDKHLIYIEPTSGRVLVRPEFARLAGDRAVCRNFIDTTFAVLSLPSDPAAKPMPDMFMKRYGYYEGQYAWVHR